MLRERLVRTEQRLSNTTESLVSTERKLTPESSYQFLKGSNSYKLNYSAYGNSTTKSAVTPSTAEAREIVIDSTDSV